MVVSTYLDWDVMDRGVNHDKKTAKITAEICESCEIAGFVIVVALLSVSCWVDFSLFSVRGAISDCNEFVYERKKEFR